MIMLGPQGSGKGTQALALAVRLGLAHIASGDVLRAARSGGTPLGNEVRRYMDAGDLVPDEITIRLLIDTVKAREGTSGVLLDGFPRTVAQAEALDEALAQQGKRVDKVIELLVPLDVVKQRLASRLTCRTCGAVYNTLTNPPQVSGVCDLDAGELYRREDDYPEAIQKRLAIWEEQNAELTRYYDAGGIRVQVNGDRPPAEVTEDLVAVLQDSDSPVTGR